MAIYSLLEDLTSSALTQRVVTPRLVSNLINGVVRVDVRAQDISIGMAKPHLDHLLLTVTLSCFSLVLLDLVSQNVEILVILKRVTLEILHIWSLRLVYIRDLPQVVLKQTLHVIFLLHKARDCRIISLFVALVYLTIGLDNRKCPSRHVRALIEQSLRSLLVVRCSLISNILFFGHKLLTILNILDLLCYLAYLSQDIIHRVQHIRVVKLVLHFVVYWH